MSFKGKFVLANNCVGLPWISNTWCDLVNNLIINNALLSTKVQVQTNFVINHTRKGFLTKLSVNFITVTYNFQTL